jgi:hypothetical protein
MEPTAIVEEVPRAADPKVTVDTADLKRRFDQLRANRSAVEAVWDEIEKYFFPLGSGGSGGVQVAEGQVQWTRPDVWDSTAIDAHQKLAAMIHGSVTNPAAQWYGLTWRDEELKGDTDSTDWLEALARIAFETLQDSDFNTEVASADQDLTGFGNTFVFEEPVDENEWKGVDFEAFPIREGYFEPNHKGAIDTFYRLLSWTPGEIYDLCRARGWSCPEDIQKKAIEGKDLSERIEIVFSIFPRREAQRAIAHTHERNQERARRRFAAAKKEEAGETPAPVEADEPTYPLAPHLRPFGCVYFRAATGERIGEERGYYEMPVLLARWEKTTGSIWGHGPCHVLLPSVRYLNGWMETAHEAAAKIVDPSWGTTERGALSDLDLAPGGISVFRNKDSIWALESRADFNVSFEVIRDLRSMIQRGLHNDELTLKDSPAMTATEVRARYEIMQRLLGSTLARIETDLLSPIIMITIGHLLRAKQVPEMPKLVAEKWAAGTLQFNIEYQGPLARSQRTDEVAAIERVFSFAVALLKMGVPLQVVLATLDVVQGIREVAERLGVPARLLKSVEEAKKAIAAFEEMDARMARASAEKTEGEAAAAHAKARASLTPPAGGAPGAVPAQPPPIIAPPYQLQPT